MRKPEGYSLWTEPDGGKKEMDTFTCRHCNCVVQIPPRATPSECGGWCFQCNGGICGKCADRFTCTPFEKKLDQYERANRFAVDANLVLN